jgi:hypothetical protein
MVEFFNRIGRERHPSSRAESRHSLRRSIFSCVGTKPTLVDVRLRLYWTATIQRASHSTFNSVQAFRGSGSLAVIVSRSFFASNLNLRDLDSVHKTNSLNF